MTEVGERYSQPEFFKQMTEQSVEQLEERARKPGTTTEEVLEWLTDLGVKTSRSAVGRFLQDFRVRDRRDRTAIRAKAYLSGVQESDPLALAQANERLLEQEVFDALSSGDDVRAKSLKDFAAAIRGGVAVKRDLVDLRQRGTQKMEELKTLASRRRLTADDIEAARKAVFG